MGEDNIADVPRSGLAGAADEGSGLGRRYDLFQKLNVKKMRGGDRTSTVACFPAVPASGTSRNPSKFQSIHDKHFDSQM